MVDSRKLGMKTTGRLGLAVVGAVLALALAPIAAQAAPTLAITSPVNGTVTGSPGMSFAGTTTDPIDPISLTISGPHGVLHETVFLPGESWASPSVPLSDGPYTVEAQQAEGFEAPSASAPVTFTVKAAGPAVGISAPSPSSEGVIYSGRAGNEPGDGSSVHLCIAVERAAECLQPLQETDVSREGGSWRFEGLGLPPGEYEIAATQSDSVGHTVTTSREFRIAKSSAPVVTLDTSEFATLGGTLVTTSATPRFSTTPVAGLGRVTLNLYPGTSAPGEPIEQVAMSATGEVWSTTLSRPLANGIYTAQAVVEDVHDNTGFSTPVIFSVQVPSTTTIAPGPSGPTASFTWVPANPAVGQTISLASNSAGGSSPINAFAWDTVGNGPFVTGGSIVTTSFATVGPHVVRLRVSDANGLSSVVQKTIGVVAPSPKLMQPFPIVRIAGAETSWGVRVRLLTVQTPPSTKVVVTCKGPGCKTKSESRVAKVSATSKNKTGAVTLAFQRFERALRAGVILQIRVSKAGQIGKFTSFKIRRHKLPQRTDACLRPNSPAPIACPAS